MRFMDTFPHTYRPWLPRSRAWCPCTVMSQVSPHLRVLFPAGALGHSSPSRASLHRGMRWLLCTARAPYHRERVRERIPLHTPAADVGLVSCEWEGILYPRLTLMWGWYHVNERLSSTHGSRWYHVNERVSFTHGWRLCGAGIMWMRVSSTHGSHWCGASIMWMRGCPLPTAAADVGLESCELECTLHTADRCWEAGIVWISVFQTQQPLMRGWYHVNELGAKWECFAHIRTPHLRRHENS